MAGWRFRARKPCSLQTHLRGEGFFNWIRRCRTPVVVAAVGYCRLSTNECSFLNQGELFGNRRP